VLVVPNGKSKPKDDLPLQNRRFPLACPRVRPASPQSVPVAPMPVVRPAQAMEVGICGVAPPHEDRARFHARDINGPIAAARSRSRRNRRASAPHALICVAAFSPRIWHGRDLTRRGPNVFPAANKGPIWGVIGTFSLRSPDLAKFRFGRRRAARTFSAGLRTPCRRHGRIAADRSGFPRP